MARGGRFGLPIRRIPLENRSGDGPERPPELKNTLDPTPKECAEVKSLLGKATRFPPELVDIVMDFAEYWACSITSIDYSVTANRSLDIHGGRDREDKFIVRPGLCSMHAAPHDSASPTDTLDASCEPSPWVSLRGIRATPIVGKQQRPHVNWMKSIRERSWRALSKGLFQP